jgi:hypothetical protein
MRLKVLVGGPEGLAAAGTRIRYQRLIPALARLGIQLTITPMDRLGGEPASEADVLLFSKITDARSLVLAGQLKGTGPLVGIDLFDNYFSQSDRSALTGQRRWLSAIAADLDFALCSTPAMAAAVRSALAEVPLHLLADPIGEPVPEPAWLAAREQRRQERASAHLSVLWFGMGDNPHFAVGLEDLAAQADHLQALVGEGRRLSLTVLTNPRALGAGGLRRLAALPLEARVEEWSEALEIQRLREADVAFLPVRRDPFSIAKSPNRVLSALLQGCQVLCPGRPDRWPLAPFTYNHGADLTRDLEGGSLRWGPNSRAALAELLESTADPGREALGLQTFLAGLGPRGRSGGSIRPIVVVVGSAIEAARLTTLGRLDCLIVASPVAPRQLRGDLWFEACNGTPGAVVGLSRRLLEQLSAERRSALLAAGADALPGGRWRFPLLNLAELLAPGGGGAMHAAVLQLALQASSLTEKAVCIAAAQDLCQWLISGLLPQARLISAEPQVELLP